ncbi:MAG TPA: ribonuclease Y [Candidatus Nitrosocosmicus sp.]|nr:ribonuclease Y [Candidatus Nitrosocosmicus sp.]
MKFNKLFSSLPFSKQKKKEADKKLQDAEIKAKEIILAAKEEALKIERQAEEGVKKTAQDAIELEKRLHTKENEIEILRKKIENEQKNLEEEKKKINEKREEILKKLQKVSDLSPEQAKDLIMRSWEDKLKGEIAKKIKSTESEIKRTADEKAKEILIDSMRYGAVDYAAEYTLSVVNLPSEDFKGRIIGKDGRNIRAFELATGVDVDLEEGGVIRLSSFDAVRREIARMSLEQLIKDGRIQPQRIEELVHKAKEDIEKTMYKAGEELVHKVGLYNIPPELIKTLGRFKYRYSYGQNMILHTLEETKIGISLAHELKADVYTVKMGCLFHDIGKVVTDKEGSHVDLGVELLKKHKMPQRVIDCVANHHEDHPFQTVEEVIVYIADAVSGGRPGARHEDFQEYLKRIKTIEDVAKEKKGVADVYALQAGRELRVIVRPEEVSDEDATIMAQKIKEELEEKFEVFPGQISITIIRESRTQAVTKI